MNAADRLRERVSKSLRGEPMEGEPLSEEQLKEMAGPSPDATERAIHQQRTAILAQDWQQRTAIVTQDWRVALVNKLPEFDPQWSPKTKEEWFKAFDRLMQYLKPGRERKGRSTG